MKNQIQRWIFLPFSIGCASKSSVAVESTCKDKEKKSSSMVKAKDSSMLFSIRKPSLASGFHRLIRSLRSGASRIFSYRDEEEEDEFEAEMEIGFPTDVKHLLHIGRDGSTVTNPNKIQENNSGPEMVSFPSISMKQLEMAMAAQANCGTENPTVQN
ncbi:hypothetical protein V2J09_014437 [Rumex salicifolius]